MLVVPSWIRCCSVKAQHESTLASLLVFMTWVGPRPLCCKLIVLITKAIHHQKPSIFTPAGRGSQTQTGLQAFLSLQGNTEFLSKGRLEPIPAKTWRAKLQTLLETVAPSKQEALLYPAPLRMDPVRQYEEFSTCLWHKRWWTWCISKDEKRRSECRCGGKVHDGVEA